MDIREDRWFAYYSLLKDFVREYDTIPAERCAFRGAKLGFWVCAQRSAYKKDMLDPPKVNLLECVDGWCWDTHEVRWHANYSLLINFVAEHGYVPTRRCVFRGFKLGVWVGTQRRAYKKDKLDPPKISLLKCVNGWSWDPAEEHWCRAHSLLLDFVAEYDVLPATTCVFRGFNLGAWINTQRRVYRNGDLDSLRAGQLECVDGWSWDPHGDQWSDAISLLNDYVAEYGDIPVGACVYRGFNLGAWRNKQRRVYKKGALEEKRIARLNAIRCWRWTN